MVQALRVVQWSTGNVGLRSLRAIIQHPELELVGLYVFSDAKVGQDAGELCGLDAVGINATNDIAAILDVKADCVLYMPHECNYDDVVAILGSGANIVTTIGAFQNPDCIDPELRTRIEHACREGQSSVHSAGSSPGFVTDALPIILSSLQRQLDCITVDEFADVSSRNSPEMLFGTLGFGGSPTGDGPEQITRHMWASRRRSFELLGKAFGLPIKEIETTTDVGLARNRTDIAAGVIEAGTIAAIRITIAAMRQGKPLFRFRANWYCTRELDVDWELMHSGWRVLRAGRRRRAT